MRNSSSTPKVMFSIEAPIRWSHAAPIVQTVPVYPVGEWHVPGSLTQPLDRGPINRAFTRP